MAKPGGFVAYKRGFIEHAGGFIAHERGSPPHERGSTYDGVRSPGDAARGAPLAHPTAGDARGSVPFVGDRMAGAEAAKTLLKEDERLRKKIVAHAYTLTRNVQAAKELAQEGIVKAIDPEDSPWDPEKQPSLLNHIGSLMNSMAWNRRRGEERHPATVYKPQKDQRPDPAPMALERMTDAEDVARYEDWLDRLRERLAGDTLALDKIRLVYEGIEDASVQAERLHCSVQEIYRANERIAYHAELVKKEATRRRAADPAGAPDPEHGETAEADE